MADIASSAPEAVTLGTFADAVMPAPMTQERMEQMYKSMLAQGRESMNQTLTSVSKERERVKKRNKRMSMGMNPLPNMERRSSVVSDAGSRASSPDVGERSARRHTVKRITSPALDAAAAAGSASAHSATDADAFFLRAGAPAGEYSPQKARRPSPAPGRAAQPKPSPRPAPPTGPPPSYLQPTASSRAAAGRSAGVLAPGTSSDSSGSITSAPAPVAAAAAAYALAGLIPAGPAVSRPSTQGSARPVSVSASALAAAAVPHIPFEDTRTRGERTPAVRPAALLPQAVRAVLTDRFTLPEAPAYTPAQPPGPSGPVYAPAHAHAKTHAAGRGAGFTAAGYGHVHTISAPPGTALGLTHTHANTHAHGPSFSQSHGAAAAALPTSDSLVVHSTHPRPLSLTHTLPPSVTDPHPASVAASAAAGPVYSELGKRGGYVIAPSSSAIAAAALPAAAVASARAGAGGMHRAQAGKVLIPNSGRLAAASGGSAAHVVSAALAATLSMDLGRSTAVFPVNLGADESLLGAAAASAAPLLSSGVFPPASARLLKGDREPETLPPSSARGGRRFEASFTEGLASSARGALTTPRSGGAYSARGGPAVPPTQLYDSAAAQTGGFSAFVGGDVFLPVSATAAAAAAGPSAALRRTATARLSSGAAATGSLGGGAGAGVATVALGSGTFVDVDAAGHAVLLQRLRASDAERRALAQRCDALEVFRLRYQRSLEDQAGLARKLSHTQRTLSALLLQQQLRGIEGIATAQAAVRDLDDVITRAEAAAKMGAAVAAAAALSAPTSTALFHPEDPAAAMALVARAAPGEAVAVVAAATGGPPGIDAPLNAKTSVAASAARLARLQLLHQSAVSAVGLELSATTQAVGALEGECARLEREAAEMRARLDACEAATERAQTAAASARGELERAEKDAWEWKEKARALQSDLAMLWREHRSVAGRNEELAPVVGEFERTRETADALQTELAAERRGRIEARARVQTLETELARVTEDLAAARAAHADCGDLGAALAAEEATSERLGAENQHATQLVSQLQWQLAVAEEANGRVQDRAVRAERELAAFQVRLEELMLWKSRELAARARRFGVAERARAAVAQLDAVVGADFGPKRRVAIVRNVAEDGPAAECGLQKGDRIMTICDRTVKKKADVLLLLMTAKANSTLPLVVLRKSGKGKSRNKVKLSLSLRVGAHGYSLEQLAALVRISHFHEDDFHALRSLRLFKLEAEAPDQLSQGDEAASSAI